MQKKKKKKKKLVRGGNNLQRKTTFSLILKMIPKIVHQPLLKHDQILTMLELTNA